MDSEGHGHRTSWQGLLRALMVVDMQTGAAGTAVGSSGGYSGGATVPREYEWQLMEVKDDFSGKQYLLDQESLIVYSQPRQTDWPLAVGRSVGGKLQLQQQRDEKGLFEKLNHYLINTKTRFRDMFDECDVRKLGYLDTQGLHRLLNQILDNLKEGELYYFQV